MTSQQFSLAAILAVGLASTAVAQDRPNKIDEALTRSLTAGCSSEKVIIRAKRGYRAGLADVLKAHGDKVTIEHGSIDAVSAEVHCGDLGTLEGFPEVLSISKDAMVQPAGVAARAAAKGKKTDSARPAQARAKRVSTIQRPGARGGSAVVERVERLARDVVRETREREAHGRWARTEQGGMFESLGLKHALGQDRTSSSVMLGDTGATAGTPVFSDWYRAAVGAAPVGVAVIDSGIDPAADFAGRITHFYDFTSGRVRRARPSDGYGHGTHVAGLIGSMYVGVAPNVNLVGLKVLNSQGQGQTSDVIRAIEFATLNQAALGIRAINLSLGHPIFEPAATDPLVQAVEAAVRSGLVVITASGNFGLNPATGEPGYAGVLSPGNAPSAVTVGAFATFETPQPGDDRVAPYSSRGPSWYDAFAKPDVVAPGHNMLSVAARNSQLRRAYERRGGSGEYMRLSGTSMAAGVTSGLAALVLQMNPKLTPNMVKMVLQFTAIPLSKNSGDAYDVLSQGAGAINGDGALVLGRAIVADAEIGADWLTGLGATFSFNSMIGGELVDWSQTIVWGPHRVRGTRLVAENRPAWALGMVWGDGIEDDNIVWGTHRWGEDEDNIVWGTAYENDDNIVWGTNFLWSDEYDDNIVWGTSFDDESVEWGRNIVWGTTLIGVEFDDNIVWGTGEGEFEDNIVWGTMTDDNLAWGDLFDDNIVWGTTRDYGELDDNIVWGTSVNWGDVVVRGMRPRTAGR